MKTSRRLLAMCIGAVLSVAGITNAAEKPSPIVGGNYLYIEEYVIGPGMIPNEAIAKASEWVRALRATGENKSVKLYIHNAGPAFALYLIFEPKSWQAIDDGGRKYLDSIDLMSEPWEWASHSDNLLSEILVE